MKNVNSVPSLYTFLSVVFAFMIHSITKLWVPMLRIRKDSTSENIQRAGKTTGHFIMVSHGVSQEQRSSGLWGRGSNLVQGASWKWHAHWDFCDSVSSSYAKAQRRLIGWHRRGAEGRSVVWRMERLQHMSASGCCTCSGNESNPPGTEHGAGSDADFSTVATLQVPFSSVFKLNRNTQLCVSYNRRMA